MKFYDWMSRLPLPRNYLVKILVVSFIGVHIPMIGAVTYILLSADIALSDTMGVLIALLIATVLGTVATMAMLYLLLAPITRAATALRAYLNERKIPSLPTRYDDEAGILLANVQETVTRLDMALDTARAQREEAVRGHRSKFQVLAGMSHDLRTPLNHVIGFAEVMTTEALGPLGSHRYRDYASGIRDSGEDLLTTLQTILDLSAHEADPDSRDLDPAGVDLAGAVDQAVRLTHFHAERCGTVIHMTVPSNADAAVVTSERSLKQIVLHALQVALGTSPTATRIDVSVAETIDHASLTVVSDLPWTLGDVPPELDDGAGPEDFPSSTPAALRLSLVNSLAAGAGATVQVGNAAGGARSLTITFRKAERKRGASQAA
ncbi:histidine kinase dimerization/phospho-acceptor domain-containing protein [Thalassobaculum sp. OXR-137]|uniref:sensor histidine kinase n=1 Tax=Thalassobaculum sp. OXR-137 TaxID=3100173 RepID=UPI002AC98B48|nr:histidine kinase dimerization/phospho-acceptor domain-containing protein [Thalassobaculum sp. OXR-137]WPZ34276.1 histidine kinase dimerization/phospho-acceptor domain-containing protein [Thalassobaculum sp. OXR-137]